MTTDQTDTILRPLVSADFANPAVLLAGTVDYSMYAFIRDRLMTAPATGLVVVELSTLAAIRRSHA